MALQIRSAIRHDVAALVALMTTFYAESNFALPSGPAARTFALHVEVGPENHTARRLYARAGYVDSGHRFLSLSASGPAHAA